jgi:putative peptidoglycan lipid II flippase
MSASASAAGEPSPEENSDSSGPSTTGRVAAAAGIMVAAVLASRVLALVRDMVVSYYFGAGMTTDAYKAAFSLPDLLYYLIAGGALSSAFIPVFTEYLTRGDEDGAWHIFSVFGTVLVVVLSLVVGLGEIFTEWLILPLCPGFTPQKLALAVSLTRIILPAQIFFFVGGLMMSTLYARNHFLMPALGPVVYNIAIIIGGMIGGALFGSYWGIYGLAWGVLVGAFLGNVVMQVWTMRRVGVRYRPSLDVRHPGVVKVAKLMLPVLLGLSLPQLCVILTRPFASMLGDAPITWLDNAIKITQMPLGIFAQALSVAIFPTLSVLAAKGDMPGLRKHFSLGLRSILFLTIPSAVLIIVLATPITALLFQRGLWTWPDSQATAAAVIFYSATIFAVSGQQMVNRGFYAMQNTLTPMLAGTVATVGFLVLNCILVGIPSFKDASVSPNVPYAIQVLKSNHLALSYSISMALYLAALLVLFRKAAGGIHSGEILSSVGRVALAALAMSAAVWGCKVLLDGALQLTDQRQMSTLKFFIQILVCTGVGGVVYLVTVKLLRVPEAEFVLGTVGKRFQRLLGRKRASG